MSAKFVVGLASVGSAVAILGSLLMAVVIFQDINNLYDVSLVNMLFDTYCVKDVMTDMVEFKVLANDAWMGMIDHQHNTPLSRQERAVRLFRGRRQGYGSTPATNAAGSSYGDDSGGKEACPAGPPGVSFS